MIPKPFAEHRFAGGDRLVGVQRVESGRSPRLLVTFNYERRSVVVEPVAVRLINAVLVLYEEERERVEWQGCSEPDEARCARIEIGVKMISIFPSNTAVDPICCDYQVAVGEADRREI